MIDGTSRSLRDGRYRVAMSFVGTCFSKSIAILAPVASSERLAAHADRFGALLADLGIATETDRVRRVEAAGRAVPWIRRIAERTIKAYGS